MRRGGACFPQPVDAAPQRDGSAAGGDACARGFFAAWPASARLEKCEATLEVLYGRETQVPVLFHVGRVGGQRAAPRHVGHVSGLFLAERQNPVRAYVLRADPHDIADPRARPVRHLHERSGR